MCNHICLCAILTFGLFIIYLLSSLEDYTVRGIETSYLYILGDDKICENVGNNDQDYLIPHADCTKFYMCQYLGGNRWKAHVIDCAENTVWDDHHKACNWFKKFKKRKENCQDYGK